MSLTLHGSPVFFALLLLVAVALSVVYYRRTVPPIPRGPKIVLVALRTLAIGLLVLALFEPLLRRVFTSVKDPRIVMVIDNSASMGITDAHVDRRNATGGIIELVKRSPRRSLIDGMLFADSASTVPVDSLVRFDASGQSTNIAAALRAAIKDGNERNVQAIVLITDGVFTAGNDPRSLASSLSVPVYTIGVGDSSDPRDIAVTAVVANNTVLLGNSMPVDVQIHSTGFNGNVATVTLYDESAIVGSQNILLHGDVKDYALTFTATPATIGQHRFRVAVTPLTGEQTDRNNARTFFVKVVDSKITVALFAGAPGPDVSFVAQALTSNPHITVLPFIQDAAGGFLPSQIKGSVSEATCIVMVDFPTHTTKAQTIAGITDVLQRKSAPLLFVWGHDVDPQLAQRFDSWLPFTFTSTRAGEELIGINVPPDALADPVMRIQGDARDSVSWHALPPTTYVESAFKAKPGSDMLASMRMFGTISHQPVIVSQHLNRVRSLAVLTSGVWRWRLMGKGLSDATGSTAPDVYTTFFTNAVQWLTSADDNKPVRIQAVKTIFTPNEEIELAGEVMDAKLAAVDDATVEASVIGTAGTFSIALEPRGNGRYHGTLSRLPEGDYSVNGSARIRDNVLGTDKSKFSVADLGTEYQDIRMNAGLLRALSSQTGGMFVSSNEAQRLFDSVFTNPRIASATTVHAAETELWTNAWMLASALSAFCVEWFIRKRKGLL